MGFGGIFAPIGFEGMMILRVFIVVVHLLNAHFCPKKKKNGEKRICKTIMYNVLVLVSK